MAEVTEVPAEQPEPEEKKEPETLNLRPDIEFHLPDKRLVRMGKPAIPSAMLLPSIIAGTTDEDHPADPMRSEFNARMAIYIRAIDGIPVTPPATAKEVGALLQRLGEDGCDLVLDLYFRYFSPLNSSQLEIVKKS